MATGSGTGTPATGATSPTLTSIRARVLQQVTSAQSGIDHMPVTVSSLTLITLRSRVETMLRSTGKSALIEHEVMTASSLTLATMRDRVELVLQDTGNAIWATGDIDEAITQVLEQYSRVKPDWAVGTITLAAAGREVSLSTLTGLLRVDKVWCPYDSASPAYPPNWVDFRVWPGSLLYVDSSDEPQNAEKVRVWYTKEHTINGLEGAGATTFPVDDDAFLIAGAAAFCARFRAIEVAELANVDADVFKRLEAWGDKMMAEFNDGLRKRDKTVGEDVYNQDLLDEAIRQALEQYSRRKPARALSTVTLSANGREIDISGVTGLIRVEKVWWDFDSVTPGHPPNWRHFYTMPGSLLYINDPSEPQSGDKVRIWHTKEQTVNGLDSAAATTFPVDDEAFLVSGAAAFAARFRVAAGAGKNRALMEWARVAMAEFNEGLKIRDWRTHSFQFDQEDIEEAIRYAMQRYSEVNPERVITSLTLAAGGREVDVSSITNYLEFERVWWPYSSSSPVYPPRWREFELFSGDLLFIDSGDEPQTGDVARVWYTRLRTLNGLDGSGVTSLPAEHETLIVMGAAGFVAAERVMDEGRRYVPRKLREWSVRMLAQFERGLKAMVKREAARYSGVAPMVALDRWDDGGDW
jgi:hypothetical protein